MSTVTNLGPGESFVVAASETNRKRVAVIDGDGKQTVKDIDAPEEFSGARVVESPLPPQERKVPRKPRPSEVKAKKAKAAKRPAAKKAPAKKAAKKGKK